MIYHLKSVFYVVHCAEKLHNAFKSVYVYVVSIHENKARWWSVAVDFLNSQQFCRPS